MHSYILVSRTFEIIDVLSLTSSILFLERLKKNFHDHVNYLSNPFVLKKLQVVSLGVVDIVNDRKFYERNNS